MIFLILFFSRSPWNTTKPKLPDKPHLSHHADLYVEPRAERYPATYKLQPPHRHPVESLYLLNSFNSEMLKHLSESKQHCTVNNVYHLLAERSHAVCLIIFLLYSRDEENHTYDVPSGLNHYIIPRSGLVFFSEMEIYVKAVNQLGVATSLPIRFEPISAGRNARTQPLMSSLLCGEYFWFFFFFNETPISVLYLIRPDTPGLGIRALKNVFFILILINFYHIFLLSEFVVKTTDVFIF